VLFAVESSNTSNTKTQVGANNGYMKAYVFDWHSPHHHLPGYWRPLGPLLMLGICELKTC
jgi:hypothetical protein